MGVFIFSAFAVVHPTSYFRIGQLQYTVSYKWCANIVQWYKRRITENQDFYYVQGEVLLGNFCILGRLQYPLSDKISVYIQAYYKNKYKISRRELWLFEKSTHFCHSWVHNHAIASGVYVRSRRETHCFKPNEALCFVYTLTSLSFS